MRTRAELLVGVLSSAGLVVLVSAVVALLKPHVPVLSLGALYVLAVLPVAILWGTALAAIVSVASMLVFNWFFLPPYHSFHLHESQNWLALAVYLVIAVVVSALAARARAGTTPSSGESRPMRWPRRLSTSCGAARSTRSWDASPPSPPAFSESGA